MARRLWIGAVVLAACLLATTGTSALARPADLAFNEPRWGAAVYLPVGGNLQVGVSAWVKGLLQPDEQLEFTIDRSALASRVKLTMMANNPCSTEGNIIRCVLTVEGWHENLGVVPQIQADPGTAPGPAGVLVAKVRPLGGNTDPNPSNNTMRMNVHVDNGYGADIDITSPIVTGSVGEIVTVPIVIINQGPNTQPYVKLSATYRNSLDDLAFLGANGCTVANDTVACEIQELEPDESYVIYLRVRVNACAVQNNQPGFNLVFAIHDRDFGSEDTLVTISRCTETGTQPTGGGTGTGPAASDSGATATPSTGPAASQAAEPPGLAISPESQSPAASTSMIHPLATTAVMIVLLTIAATLGIRLILRRRRLRSATHA